MEGYGRVWIWKNGEARSVTRQDVREEDLSQSNVGRAKNQVESSEDRNW
jgi:hypothetical protein